MVALFTYLVTKDVVETLRNRYGLNIPDGFDIQIKNLENRFVDRFWRTSGLPAAVDKCALDASELSAKLKILLREMPHYISLDDVYFPEAPAYLEVTRRINPETGKVELAERSGKRSLTEQISSFKRNNEISLVDVGAFSGDTLLQICDMFEKQNLPINNIYLGVSDYKIGTKINGRKKVTVVKQFNFYEWIELRDLIGIDGRSVGIENNIRTYIPYWENLKEWASIPESRAEEVASLCKEYNSYLLDLVRSTDYNIDERMGRPIKLKYLKRR